MEKVIGICRARNEEHIIWDTLNHVSELVDEIIIFDDASTDNTVELCEAYPKVSTIIRNKRWEKDPVARNAAEGDYRQKAYIEAVKRGAEWVYCFDADEFAYFENIDVTYRGIDAYRLRLFDYYITPNDIDKEWFERKWIGPEYRDILMLFRVIDGIKFHQREPTIPGTKKTIVTATVGSVKHYGKAISEKHWEETCDYYINHRGSNDPQFEKFKRKWKARKGKAIHKGVSDFGFKLIKWVERYSKGFPLTPEIDK